MFTSNSLPPMLAVSKAGVPSSGEVVVKLGIEKAFRCLSVTAPKLGLAVETLEIASP